MPCPEIQLHRRRDRPTDGRNWVRQKERRATLKDLFCRMSGKNFSALSALLFVASLADGRAEGTRPRFHAYLLCQGEIPGRYFRPAATRYVGASAGNFSEVGQCRRFVQCSIAFLFDNNIFNCSYFICHIVQWTPSSKGSSFN